MTMGFVLSGGGSVGAIQVGMLRAPLRHDVVPDLVVGTSIGGLNAVAFAADPTASEVATLAGRWGEIQRHDVYPLDPGEVWRAVTGSLPLDPVGGALRALGVRNAAVPVRPVAAVLGAFGLRDYLVPSRPRERFLAREIPTRFSCDLPRPPATALGMAVHALALLIEQYDARSAEPTGIGDAGSPTMRPT